MNKDLIKPIGIEKPDDQAIIARMLSRDDLRIYKQSDVVFTVQPETTTYRIAITVRPERCTDDEINDIVNTAARAMTDHLHFIKDDAKRWLRAQDASLRGHAVRNFHEALRQGASLAMKGVCTLAKREFQYTTDAEFGLHTTLRPVTVWFDVTTTMLTVEKGKQKFSYHTRAYYAYVHLQEVNKQYINQEGN